MYMVCRRSLAPSIECCFGDPNTGEAGHHVHVDREDGDENKQQAQQHLAPHKRKGLAGVEQAIVDKDTCTQAQLDTCCSDWMRARAAAGTAR